MKKAASSVIRNGKTRLQQRQFSQVALPPLRITTLPNKIRVATESTPGHFSSVGLYIDAGSRYEDPSTSGASHFLDRMAFKVYLFVHLKFLCLTAYRQHVHVLKRKWLQQWTSWEVKSCARPLVNRSCTNPPTSIRPLRPLYRSYLTQS